MNETTTRYPEPVRVSTYWTLLMKRQPSVDPWEQMRIESEAFYAFCEQQEQARRRRLAGVS